MAEGTVTRVYGGFRGIDARGGEVNLMRSPDCLNVWKDYKETDSIRTRPEMTQIMPLDGNVYGIFFYGEETIVHCGTKLYRVRDGVTEMLYDGVLETQSNAFVYEGVFYFKDGNVYLQYDGTEIADVEGYVPTTTIGKKPTGEGSTYEDVNMLTGRRKNTFLSDGLSIHYYLDAKNLDEDFPPIVKVDDVVVTNYTVDYEEGKISFTGKLPGKPKPDGQDNVSVEFKKTVATYRECILGSKLMQVFDNRVFVSGNDQYPNVVWHCSLNDPTYFSDLDYYREGIDSAKVKGLVAGNNALWVFREPSDANTTAFYHTPSLDPEYGKIYPSSHSSITTGCIGAAINFNDDIVFFSERGMEGISGDITTEQVVAHRSSLVDSLMLSEKDYGRMILAEWEGYLLVFIGDKVYLADSRTAFTMENHYEYEWFVWKLPRKVTCATVKDGVLHLGTEDGIYTLTDTEAAVESYWVTPKDKFKAPNMQKTTNKRGCVAEGSGDVTVLAKTEKTEFEEIGVHTNVTDYFVSRIKRKKFKDLQLKFHSRTRFALEQVTLEVFVGAYIKR